MNGYAEIINPDDLTAPIYADLADIAGVRLPDDAIKRSPGTDAFRGILLYHSYRVPFTNTTPLVGITRRRMVSGSFSFT